MKGEITYEGKNLQTMSVEERSQAGLFLSFQYPVEIPGVSNSYFLRSALNAIRVSRGEKELDGATSEDLVQVADQFDKTRTKYLKMVLHDAGKEFGAAVQTGFGQDGAGEDVAADFASVRGDYETNKFVRQLDGEITALADRLERFKKAVAELSVE